MELFRKTISAALAVVMAAGITAAAPLTAYAKETDPDPVQVSIARLGGRDRYETANMIADAGWTSADTVFLANSASYADALAGTPLAYAHSAPILLTGSNELPDTVGAEIKKLGAKKVILLGGTAVIGADIENGLKTAGYAVERVAGETRYGTALKIAEALAAMGDGIANDVFIASGVNYPDALSASSPAALKHAPILYAPADGKLDEASAAFIARSRPYNAYILGGKAAVGEAAEDAAKKAGAESVERLGGSDRYETSLKIARRFDPQFKGDDIAFATGTNFPDALAGSVLAARSGIPVLLTDNKTVRDDVKSYIAERERSKVYVFGGTSVVSDEIINGYIVRSSAGIRPGAAVENGMLVIRIGVSSGGNAWTADETAQDNGVLKYEGSEVRDGFFTARYSAAGDGATAVRARHFYSNTICDELRSWDVTVKDGKIADVSEERVKKSPDETALDAVISGSWEEYPSPYDEMTVSKNESKGWNVEITSPVSRGSFIFKATVYYDCESECFAYNKGKFFDIPLDGKGSLGEASVMGATGYFKLSGDGKDAVLAWHNDAQDDMEAIDTAFTRVDPDNIDAGIYAGDYVWDRCSVNVSTTDNKNELAFEVKWSGGANTTTFWNMSGTLDPAAGVVAYTNSVKVTHNYDSSGNDSPVVVYENGTGYFEFDEKNLLWNEDKDGSAKGKVFSLSGSDDYTDRHDEAVKEAVEQYIRSGNLNAIEDIIFNMVNIYSEEEIAANPALKEYVLGERDLVFDISYDIKVVKGTDTAIYAIPDGETDGQWVRNISRVGVVRYADDKYSLDPKYFGTGF